MNGIYTDRFGNLHGELAKKREYTLDLCNFLTNLEIKKAKEGKLSPEDCYRLHKSRKPLNLLDLKGKQRRSRKVHLKRRLKRHLQNVIGKKVGNLNLIY